MKPIIFSTEMVRAILDNNKTQTRRVIKPQPYAQCVRCIPHGDQFLQVLLDGEKKEFTLGNVNQRLKPAYNRGDLLWVRETWALAGKHNNLCHEADDYVIYKASNPEASDEYEGWRWKTPIFMPRWASRITLEVTSVRAETVQDITEDEAIAEGVITGHDPNSLYDVGGGFAYFSPHDNTYFDTPIEAFAHLWDSIYAKQGYGWDANPWVWAIKFKVKEIKQNALH